MERRVANAFPGAGPPPPQVPYYHNNNNNNYNPHQIHPSHHHVSAVGFHQYPQNDNRDQRFNQPHFDNQQQHNMIVDAPPSSEFSPCGGGSSLRKRRSLSSSTTPGNTSKFDSFLHIRRKGVNFCDFTIEKNGFFSFFMKILLLLLMVVLPSYMLRLFQRLLRKTM